MKIDIMTLFPDTVNAVLHESIIGRACAKGIVEINCVQIRDFTENRQMQVDDYPYGGGWGCVMMAQPLKSCLESLVKPGEEKSRVIYMSPQGKPYNQETAKRLSAEYEHLVLVCGHYEGVDERFIQQCVDEEISMGDFVLTGGEIAAMAVADSVCRLIPGVLSDEECYTGESHWNGLLEYPQYTRPEVWEGRSVPEILKCGDHGKIARWRREMSIRRTMEKRPDMFQKLAFTDKADVEILERIKRESGRIKLTEVTLCRPAQPGDLDDIMAIAAQARESLKKMRIDQWQGEYPGAENFLDDIEKERCYVLKYQGETAGFFALSTLHEDNYDEITDGKWHYNGPYCVLHRAAIGKKFRGSGMSEKLMSFVDETAKGLGFKSVRSDTHRKNEPMKKLLVQSGYRYRGNVLVASEPGHDPKRQGFEKVFKA